MTAALRLPVLASPPPARGRPSIRREEVPPEQWTDWRWQLRHRLTCLEDIEPLVQLTPAERAGLRAAPGLFRIGITPYYFSLIDPVHPYCPVRMQVIPVVDETLQAAGEYRDPLGEDSLSPTPGLVHRYPDRVLLLALDRCAIYCRHCNRRRLVGQQSPIAQDSLAAALDYIRAHREIRDVLISGGDPLILSTEKLEWLLQQVRSIPHVDVIRLGTRVPVCLPMRVDQELCRMLRRFHPLYINTHFNHPKELTPEARQACEMLADAGIPLGNQTVLLRRVNSSARTLEALFRGLLRMRVRPYYLFQGDPVFGTDHLRTPVSAGIEIMEQLRGRLTGMAMPQLVLDAPGGAGKIPIGPTYLLTMGTDRVKLRSYDDRIVEYIEPRDRDCTCPYEAVYFAGEGPCI
ncbi:MAG: KamA family radical SAM protein [Myxococcales bacterium]|nr:KamA family radical SAM protein [Myxococcota bacterium]MDW8280656.1 KamA family radical SAM protein [Myxococcales bacterium]